MKINIRPDESALIIGRKGTGKTKIMEYLMELYKPQGHARQIVLDTKQAGDFTKYPRVDRLRDIPKLVSKYPTIVYAPNKSEAKDPDYIEGFFAWCYDRWNTRVCVDELGSIVHGNDVPESYRDITDRGRARRVTFFQGTQKPVFIPHAALSESDHFFLLDLQVETARKKMAGIISEAVMKRPVDPHGFWYYHHSMQNPTYIPGIKL